MGKDPDQIRRKIEYTRDRMGETVDALAYKADVPNRVKDSIADRVDGVKSAIGGTATKVRSAVTGTTARVGDVLPDGRDVREGAAHAVGMVKENPLGLFLSGVAIGFVCASLLPSTDLENEQLGEISDNLKDQVKGVSNQALDHGKAVLRETAEAAQRSAQEHGQRLGEQLQQNMANPDLGRFATE